MQSEKLRSPMIRFAYAVLISAILFTLLSPETSLFLFFLDLIWLLALLCYGSRKNRHFLANGIVVTAACAVAFLASKIITGHQLRTFTNTEWVLLFVGAAEVATAAVMCFFPLKHLQEEQELYKERRDDLERIQKYIQEYEIVGVNAIWGAGKSFIVEHLKRQDKMREQFEMIQIDLLSCDLDAVELILVEEMEKVFQKNRVYPEGSRRLKNLLGKNQWADMLGGLIVGNSVGLSASFDSFRQELGKLDKRILIIFEDIDRIFDRDTIQKIFAISEKLSCDRLHVLFQYDMDVLEKKGFERNYLEKYIPYTVNLTPISFQKLVGYLWEEFDMSGIPLKREDVDIIGRNLSGRYEAERITGMNMAISVNIDDGISTRKVRFFLRELREMLLDNDAYYGEENAKTVMHAVFIKHFFSSYFDMLRTGESPLQSWKLLWKKKEYTVPEILDMFRKQDEAGRGQGDEKKAEERFENLRHLLKEERNRNALGLIFLLGYELQIAPIRRNWDELVTESENNLSKKEKNEKIDRIVWNVLANGKSELTNAENAVRKLQEVLAEEGEAQERAWAQYREDMFYQRLRKDNSTIFRMGADPFFALFQSMKIVGAEEEKWEKFLTFYFSQYQKGSEHKKISVPLVDNLNYCNLRSKKIFFQVIRFVNGLQVDGNLNGEKSYKLFWENYLGAVTVLGYTEYTGYWMLKLQGSISQSMKEAESLMEQLLRELRRRQEEQKLDYVKEEYSDIIHFVEKNQEMIQCKTAAPKRGPYLKTEAHSRWQHQEEVDRLKQLWKEGDQEQFALELRKSYLEGKLYLQELEAVLRDCQRVT